MNRHGAVLVVVLLAVLGLELAAMSALGLARLAQLGALHARARASLQTAAEDAVTYAAATLRADRAVAHPAGVAWSIEIPHAGAVTLAARARRLAGGLVLIDASATAQGGRMAAAAASVRVLEPDSILAGFPAVVGTTVPAAVPAAPPAADSCPVGTAPAARPPYAVLAAGDTLPFGRAAGIRWEHVTVMAGAPAAAPEPAAYPAGARLLSVSGDTTITGRFVGVLVVDGDLRIQGDGEVHGLAVVRGLLVLEPGARLRGAARALAAEAAGGSAAWDRCAIDAALRVDALQRAYRPATRWRLPAF